MNEGSSAGLCKCGRPLYTIEVRNGRVFCGGCGYETRRAPATQSPQPKGLRNPP